MFSLREHGPPHGPHIIAPDQEQESARSRLDPSDQRTLSCRIGTRLGSSVWSEVRVGLGAQSACLWVPAHRGAAGRARSCRVRAGRRGRRTRRHGRGRPPRRSPRLARRRAAGPATGSRLAFEMRREPIHMYRKRPVAIHRQEHLPARAAVCRIPCLILCLADVERVCQCRAPNAPCGLHRRMASVIASNRSLKRTVREVRQS